MKKTLLYLLLATVVLIAPALAAPIACPTGATPLSTYMGYAEGCYISDKVFSDFDYSGTGTNPMPADQINVAPIDAGGYLGLEFSGAWGVTSGQSQDSLITYQVATATPLITSLHLQFNGIYTGTGVSNVVETYCLGGVGCATGQLSVTNPPLKLQDDVFFAPVSLVGVKKDIYLSGGLDGSATVSYVDNTFDQVPEPAAFGLAGLGLLALALRRKFSRS